VNSILPGVTATPIVQKYVDTENVQGVLRRTPRGVMAGMHACIFICINVTSCFKSRQTYFYNWIFFTDSKEIAHSIVYLLSDFASNITGGQLASDGGFLVN
jgi:NAD(P)-dependent dehydrogenase (short-subunit alcohol dehydrogenase family)